MSRDFEPLSISGVRVVLRKARTARGLMLITLVAGFLAGGERLWMRRIAFLKIADAHASRVFDYGENRENGCWKDEFLQERTGRGSGLTNEFAVRLDWRFGITSTNWSGNIGSRRRIRGFPLSPIHRSSDAAHSLACLPLPLSTELNRDGVLWIAHQATVVRVDGIRDRKERIDRYWKEIDEMCKVINFD